LWETFDSTLVRRPRIVCTVAPKEWFGGRDYLGGKALSDAVAALGYDVLLLDTECFFVQHARRIEEAVRSVRQFAPDFAISTPNAGYGLGTQVKVAGRLSNLFTDLLEIPLALSWDDPLGQFAGVFLAPLPASMEDSQPDALQRLRKGIAHPLIRHFAWDTGHIQTMVKLGLLRQEQADFRMLPAKQAYIDCGNAGASTHEHDVCFAGNVYLNQITADPLHEVSELAQLGDRIATRKLADFAPSTWELLMTEVQQLPDAERARLKLSPDDSFFWQAYRYLVWVAVNTRVRMGVLSGVEHTIDFYGAFADPKSVDLLNDYPNVRYRGSVDYVRELPHVFSRSKITVDVTNQLAQHSVPAKFFECFAAGGFMLVDRRPDLIAAFGDAADAVTYTTLDELNAKIDFYLTHESQRRDLVGHFKDVIHREHSIQKWTEQQIEDMMSRGGMSRRARANEHPEATEPLVPWNDTFMGEALWRQRHTLADARTNTRALHDALRRYMPEGHPGDLPFHEWGQLMACALEFAPDLILEVGRGYGNSTLAFTQAANLLGASRCRVVSVCLTPWDEIYAAVLPATTPDWFSPLTIHRGDIRQFDFEGAVLGARKVLVFWDAHGYEVAESILAKLMPILATREHVVLMHDIGDARYQEATSYGKYGIWKGEEVWPGPMVRLGNIFATVQQAVAIVDFSSRNGFTLRSAIHSLRSRFDDPIDDRRAIKKLLGDEFFSRRSGIAWYSLNEAPGPYHFPRMPTG
jgi:hypothetical protein